MQIKDVTEARKFADDLKGRMDSCDNGEGSDCTRLDGSLVSYAMLCCEFIGKVREWARAVFTGRIEFNPEVEAILLKEGNNLLARAKLLAEFGQHAEAQCFMLYGLTLLQASLWQLSNLLGSWVSPRLAVGPAAREGMGKQSEQAKQETRKRLEALPPLSATWLPEDDQQRARFRKLTR